MTIPEERYRSIEQARQFMLRLLNPKATPGVPKKVRLESRARLKHFPTPAEMTLLCETAERKLHGSN